jgi:hypothetical protein
MRHGTILGSSLLSRLQLKLDKHTIHVSFQLTNLREYDRFTSWLLGYRFHSPFRGHQAELILPLTMRQPTSGVVYPASSEDNTITIDYHLSRLRYV